VPSSACLTRLSQSNSSSISADLEQCKSPASAGFNSPKALISSPGYNRSVLILFQVEDETALRIAANGVDWTLEQLNSDTESPSESTELIVSALLKNLEWGDQRVTKSITDINRSIYRMNDRRKFAGALRDRAVAWGRADLWNSVISYCLRDVGKLGPAIEAFNLKDIKPGCDGSRFLIYKENVFLMLLV
jgi:hypothetical protein